MIRRLPVSAAVILLLLLLLSPAKGDVRYEIQIPDLPGYQTLKCDFHMHTVFSDGEVWPPVRVGEAWRQGLDAISITDHIEYQPHEEDIPTRHHRPFQLAAGAARAANLLFPRGAEITRDTPPGHFNAIFLKEIPPLEVDDFVTVIKRANEQGAFVFWNHQGWKGAEKGRWLEVHTTLYENKWLHGMEVCNGNEYYSDAHRWCLEKNLTMLGNSDIHAPDRRERSSSDNHRTMTLVFAKERTMEALHEALTAGRTAVWFHEQVIGRRPLLDALFSECVQVAQPHLRTKDTVFVEIRNRSDLEIQLSRTGDLGPAQATLPPQSISLLKLKLSNPKSAARLAYTATNFLIAPGEGLPVTLEIAGE